MTATNPEAAGGASSEGAGDIGARVLERADRLAAESAWVDGIHRVYLSPQHAAVNRIVGGWMTEAGLTVREDAAGNLVGRVEGSAPGLPALVLGSHLDTVPDAGRYDGILGVLAGIETVRALVGTGRTGRLPFALEVIAFGDEEGTRFGATLLGSRAVAGSWDPTWWQLVDAEGITLAEAFREFGLDPSRIGEAARDARDLAGYLEVHIEQGPRLEEAGRALGVVTSIAAATRFRVRFTGDARHAATPYDRRRDALAGAAEAIALVERVGLEGVTPAVVGSIHVEPGGVNVIAGLAEFSLDLRAETAALRDAGWERLRDGFEAIASRRGLEVQWQATHSAPEVRCASRLRAAVRSGIAATGDAEPLELFSIAGHDAMAIAGVAEVGMIFVRCAGGISHHPDESITADDAATAVSALTASVLALAGDR